MEPTAPHTPNMASSYLVNLEPPTTSNPLRIKYILTDLDGTMTNTYAVFSAVKALATHLSKSMAKDKKVILSELALYVKKHSSIESLLHQPEETLVKIALKYAQDNNYKFPCVAGTEAGHILHIPAIKTEMDKTFSLFPGVKEFLAAAKKAGTYCDVFTNTAPENTVRRLIKAGVPADHIGNIWTRTQCEQELKSVYTWHIGEKERPYVEKIHPYKDPKPNQLPLHSVQRQHGLSPKEILFIGEGIQDMATALVEPKTLNFTSDLHVRFAFQLHGASITGTSAAFNDMLRKGHPFLGLTRFRMQYPHVDKHPGIVVLRKGFKTLLEMHREGSLVLEATPDCHTQFLNAANKIPPPMSLS